MLDWRYDVHARSIARTLASRPGMRAAGAGDTEEALVGDLVAVRAYVSDDGLDVDQSLRSADPSAVLAAAGCIESGLRRLPSYRGAVFRGGQAPRNSAAYVPGAPSREAALPGDAVFVVWSATGRRTGSLEPDSADEVVFPANSAFKVLDVDPANGSPDLRVLLREIPPRAGLVATGSALDDEDTAALERLQQVCADRQPSGTPVTESYRHTFPIGVDEDGHPYTPPTLS